MTISDEEWDACEQMILCMQRHDLVWDVVFSRVQSRLQTRMYDRLYDGRPGLVLSRVFRRVSNVWRAFSQW